MSETSTALGPAHAPACEVGGDNGRDECALSRCSERATCYGLTSCTSCAWTPPKGVPLCDRHGHIAQEHVAIPCGRCPKGVARVYALDRL